MKVSVVMSVWNAAATVRRAVLSAVRQNPDEMLVVDDGSTDGTPQILSELKRDHPCLRVERNEPKADDWQAALYARFPSLVGEHVIGMGADDAVNDGLVDSVRKHGQAAVVFHDYLVANTAGAITSGLWMGFNAVTWLTPEQVQQRMLTYPYACETGIGSSIRKEHLLWLIEREFWKLGPWSDAIGYSLIAAMHGCVFVPGAGAIFTQDDAGYGCSHRGGTRAAEYHAAARRLVDSVDLPPGVRAAICTRREVPYG